LKCRVTSSDLYVQNTTKVDGGMERHPLEISTAECLQVAKEKCDLNWSFELRYKPL
jgi:hypothetical protein